MKPITTKFEVPIYDAIVYVVIADDLNKEYTKLEKVLGKNEYKDDEGYDALCVQGPCKNFGLFFDPTCISLGLIAHEVFHLTHRIMEWVECNFDPTHHEQGAYLNAFLLTKVNDIILLKVNKYINKSKKKKTKKING